MTPLSPSITVQPAQHGALGSTPTPCHPSLYLDLAPMKCFEVIDRQFERQGVIFQNAIALQPSNPVFPHRSGIPVLMGAPRSGWLEAQFLRSAQEVSCRVTSSRRLLLSAYSPNQELIAQAELPGANLVGKEMTLPPNQRLVVQGQAIQRVTFQAFDGEFTIDEFCVIFA